MFADDYSVPSRANVDFPTTPKNQTFGTTATGTRFIFFSFS